MLHVIVVEPLLLHVYAGINICKSTCITYGLTYTWCLHTLFVNFINTLLVP